MSGEKALPARILLVKPSSLGDIIHTLPLAHALKRCAPDCSIGWVVEEAFQEILLADASIETVYPIRIPSTSNPGADSRLQAYWQAFVATSSVLAGSSASSAEKSFKLRNTPKKLKINAVSAIF